MMFECLKLEKSASGIWHIYLARPDKLNALNATLLSEIDAVLDQADLDPSCLGLLFTGEGKAFCAGADINRLQSLNALDGSAFAAAGQRVFRRLETFKKPSLAAINGFAFGGGCELAMAMHVRIASDKAQFGQPEVKLGVVPCYGGTQRLTRLVGKGRAMDLCMTGRFIDAVTAYQWGLVTEVTTPDQLLARGQALLQMMVSNGPLAIQAVAQCIDQGLDMNLDEALALEVLHFARLCASQDKQEGVAAFLAKRPAQFNGQ